MRSMWETSAKEKKKSRVTRNWQQDHMGHLTVGALKSHFNYCWPVNCCIQAQQLSGISDRYTETIVFWKLNVLSGSLFVETVEHRLCNKMFLGYMYWTSQVADSSVTWPDTSCVLTYFNWYWITHLCILQQWVTHRILQQNSGWAKA